MMKGSRKRTLSVGGLVLQVVLLSLLLSSTAVVTATPRDPGQPDSAYFGTPFYQYQNCQREILLAVPVHLVADTIFNLVVFDFKWSGPAELDGAVPGAGWANQNGDLNVRINSERQLGQVILGKGLEFFEPARGALAELVFKIGLGDTLELELPPSGFRLHSSVGLEWWTPGYLDLNEGFIAPDTLEVLPGDTDCSGSVTVGDLLIPLAFVFHDSVPPYDLNSADTNGDGRIDISDVVYLISYIFYGGPPPLPGKIVEPGGID
jgi:hypothetical protein